MNEKPTYEEVVKENERLKQAIVACLSFVALKDRDKPFNDADLCGEMVSIRLTGLCCLVHAINPDARKKAFEQMLADFGNITDAEAEHFGMKEDIDRRTWENLIVNGNPTEQQLAREALARKNPS